jgi:phosphomevalonate kinase
MGVEWDNLHEKLALPHQMRLILGDVSEGSNTPKMVSKVLQWKRENEAESTGNFLLFYYFILLLFYLFIFFPST